jgi:alanyl-tRNA synthetase
VDELKNKSDKVAVLLFQVNESKVTITAGAKNCPIKAGAWIKQIAPIVGGGGGGRDDFAQAGGKDASRLGEAKAAALEYAKSILNG